VESSLGMASAIEHEQITYWVSRFLVSMIPETQKRPETTENLKLVGDLYFRIKPPTK
jgi:hypothetical protein